MVYIVTNAMKIVYHVMAKNVQNVLTAIFQIIWIVLNVIVILEYDSTKCSQNCLEYTKSECIKCFDGYYLNNKNCFKCNDNCLLCDDALKIV